jgi:hypothetical protein
MGCAPVPSKLMTSCHRLRGDLRLAHDAIGVPLALCRTESLVSNHMVR